MKIHWIMLSLLDWHFHNILKKMIHYTLLPEKEMRSLKREYRIRVFITLIFFISCGIIIGIMSLFPAFILSYSQGKDSLDKIETIQKSRESRGIDTISKDLSDNYQMIKKLKTGNGMMKVSEIVFEISKLRPSQISLTSLKIDKEKETATSSISIILQGKAIARESLITFKKNLEGDKRIIKVELPISDLAKSKNISFSVRLILNP